MTRRPLLTRAQQETLLTTTAAVYGFAVAVSASVKLIGPARRGQLPGFMKAHDLDARSPALVLLTVVVLTIGAAFAARPLQRLLFEDGVRRWARNAVMASFVVALWHATVVRDLLWTAVPPLVVVTVAVLLRRIDAQFSRRDALLLPAFAAVYIGLADATTLTVERDVIVAAGVVLAARLAILFLRRGRGLAAPLCFALAPLALLFEAHFLGRNERYLGWPAIAFALATPFVLRLSIRDSALARKRLRTAIAFAIYPIAAYAYLSATSLATAEGRPRVDFFEDAQHMTPAAEMLRGERPYREILPPHGLIQDGLFDYALLKGGPVTAGTVVRNREIVGRCIGLAAYATTAGITGSADAGILAFFFAATVGAAAGSVRFVPALIALALLAAAARWRSVRLLAAGGAFAILAGLTSAEFGAYSVIVTALTAYRMGSNASERKRTFAWAVGGAAAVVVPASIAMMIAGFFTDYLRVTLTEVMTVGPAYALAPFDPPEAMKRPLPDVLVSVFDPTSALYLLWIASLAGVAILVARPPSARRRARMWIEPLIVVAVWTVVVGISYAERHHTYFCFAAAPLMVGTAWLLLRSRSSFSRVAGIGLTAITLVLSAVTAHLSISAAVRDMRGPMDPAWREMGLPRAQGALFFQRDIGIVDAVKRYSESRFKPGDTFFDLTNRPMLYFMLDRDVPIRQLEVGFYESEERQREVIDRIARNPHVRAAIVPLPENDTVGSIDFVINARRVPLVWKYLTENFEPDFQEGEVAIWRRK